MLYVFLYIPLNQSMKGWLNEKEPDKQEYQQIVKNLTPKHNSLLIVQRHLWLEVCFVFWVK